MHMHIINKSLGRLEVSRSEGKRYTDAQNLKRNDSLPKYFLKIDRKLMFD